MVYKVSPNVYYINFILHLSNLGSGKSWFCRALRARSPNLWHRISQDDSGSRAACENDIGRNNLEKKVILDRCNPDAKDRVYWRQLAQWAKNPIIVWLDYPKELCISRAQRRLGHQTLRPGPRVRNAIASTATQFQPPTMREGVTGIAVIRSFAACQELVRLLSPPIELFKFPRTAHLINLGAASDDDIHHNLSGTNLAPGSKVIITEKVDGANLGISLDENSRIVIQNRSHWVNSKTHFQFKRLDLWVEENREGLYKILGDPLFPERFVLFGEWMVCVHSIQYNRLPDRFLAFDLYDRSNGTFAAREVLEAKLEGTGISLVPVLEYDQTTIPSEETLKAMVQAQSKFYDGSVEGIYLKIEHGSRVLERGKVVRSDFIAGNEHWTRGNLTLNGIVKVCFF